MRSKIELNCGSFTFFKIEDLERFKDTGTFRGRLTLRSGNFSCEDREFYFDDLEKFRQDLKNLYESLSGVATLRDQFEPDIIKIEAIERGNIIVSGEIMSIISCLNI
jgi:hypothetical protein